MSSLGSGDKDLHVEGGEHRLATPPGWMPEVHQRRLRLHLEAHAYNEYLDGMLDELNEEREA